MSLSTVWLVLRGALTANRWRMAFTIACIALGVALGGAVHTVHTSALAEIDRSARALAGRADLEVRGPRNGFDDALFVALAKRPEVVAASPVVEVDAAIAGAGRDTLRVLGIDPMRAIRLQAAFVADANATGLEGAPALLDGRSAWLSPLAAANRGLAAGGTLRLVSGTGERDFRIAGVLPGLATAGEAAVIDIAAAQSAFGRVGTLSRIDLRLAPGVDRERFAASLAALLPPGVLATPPASLGERAASITRAYRVNLDALALIALATGAFLVFSTLALQAARRRQEYALLRALGLRRRDVAALLAVEGASIGAVGALLGTALGLEASRFLLQRVGTDLGAGYFSGEGAVFAPHAGALAVIAALGVAMAVAAALAVARAVGRMDVSEGLRDRSIDLPSGRGGGMRAAALFALAGIPLLFVPAIGGLPLGGYAAILAWLVASVLAVGPACRAILARMGAPASPVANLALAQVRHLPGHLSASVAGIVVSASLCVAMAIMVFSFRVSLADWLGGVVGADLYVRSGAGGETGYLDADEQRRVGALPQVARMEALRFDRLAVTPQAQPLTLIARPIDARILEGFRADPPGVPARGAEIPVWISEAVRDLHGWHPGDRVELPIAGRATPVRVAGVIRDYARTWGAVLIPVEDYRRVTGDTRANDLALHLAAGVTVEAAEAALRATLPAARGLAFEDARELRTRSLALFDRTFAVTYALEAIAIVIGLAGMTSSFAALAWSRRREFGVLRFLGFRRGEVLRMLAVEGAAAGALGSAIGLVTGIAMSLVLIHVVNRQSFHWTMEVHWPVAGLAALLGAIVALCAAGARLSGALAVRKEAVLAVKDDA